MPVALHAPSVNRREKLDADPGQFCSPIDTPSEISGGLNGWTQHSNL